MSKIAVLLASYNGEKYIREQILSIQNQKNVTIDIFLRDDKSKDNTVKESLELLPSNRVVINECATGSAANNFFLSILDFKDVGNYDYFAFADQDDIWLPEKLKKAVNALEGNDGELYTSNLLVWDTKNNSKTLLKKDYAQKKFDHLFEGGSAGCTYVFTQSFFLILRERIQKTAYLNWSNFSHDWFAYFIARSIKEKVIISSDAEILYRIHDYNVHGQLNSINLKSISTRIKMVKNGWYLDNSVNCAKCLESDSEEFEIYKLYCKNFFTRMKVLIKYNFSLMRSKRKFLIFFFLSIFCSGYINQQTFKSVFQISNRNKK